MARRAADPYLPWLTVRVLIPMKIRELTIVERGTWLAWPPRWAAVSFAAGDTVPLGLDGVLTAIRQTGAFLVLTMEFEGRRHVGLLRWTPPPSLEQVAQVLRERVGQAIAKLSEVEMP